MDEIWERAVETALDGQTDLASVRTLTLDGAVKCFHGRLPPPSRVEKFQNLQHLSLANIGLSSLDHFPRLKNLQKLILSDNRIAGGLELLVEAGLELLRDLDLSNNRIQDINDLKPLRELKLVSLDLYECPVTRVKDYRSRVFGLIKSLKYLDKMDAEENERPESEDDEDEEDDPGSGEIDGEDRSYRMSNGHSAGGEGVIDVDEDEESDADGEEREMLRGSGGWNPASLNHYSNVFGVVATGDREEEEEGEDEGEDDNDLVEEIDEEEDEDEDEVYEIDDSDDDEDGVEDDVDDEDSEDEEEVDNDEGDFGELESTGRLVSTEGEIDGHEQGEEDGEEDDGETGEEGQCVEEDGVFEEEEDAEEEDDDYAGYLLQPVRRAEENAGGSDIDLGNDSDPEMEEDVEYEDEDGDGDEDDAVQVQPPSSSHKRKRDEDDSEEEDDDVGYAKSSKHR
ncbi:hypothetical protein CsSME_00003905 [Camellia sinensis var. sinensis]